MKTFKNIFVLLLGVMCLFFVTACHNIEDVVKRTLSEQRVEFYNYAIDDEGATTYEAIDNDSIIHLCFPFAAANQIASKFEYKASKLYVEIEYFGETKYPSTSFVVNLLKDYKDNYIVLVDNDIKAPLMDAVSIDPILEDDAARFKPYYSAECKNEKYYTSGGNGYALKVSIDLSKLDDITGFGAMKKDDVDYIKFSFTLISTGGFDSGETNSLYESYVLDGEKYIKYVAKAEHEPEPSDDPTIADPEDPTTEPGDDPVTVDPEDPTGEPTEDPNNDPENGEGNEQTTNSEDPEGGEEGSEVNPEDPATGDVDPVDSGTSEVPEGEEEPTNNEEPTVDGGEGEGQTEPEPESTEGE